MCLAVVGRVLRTEGEGVLRVAHAEVAGAVREVTLTFAPEARVGDLVMIHSGHALRVVGDADPGVSGRPASPGR